MLYDQYLAIDYGSRYIKGILFKNVLGTVTPIRFETLPKIHLNDEEGDEYEYNIIRFIQSFFPEESKFLVNLSIDRLFVRDLIIPLTSEKAVREIIPFEVENKLPFPTETMEVLGILSKIDQENSYVVTFNVQQDEISNVMDKYNNIDIFLLDLNKSNKEYLCTDVLYLVEPSILKLNKLAIINPKIINDIKGKKVVLNKSLLSESEIADFEVETRIKVYYNIPPLNDKKDNSDILSPLLEKLGYIKKSEETEKKKSIFDFLKLK